MDKKRLLRRLKFNDVTTGSIRYIKRFLCGEKIGSGVYRQVYQCKLNRNYVVKIQPAPAFENQLEYRIWKEIGHIDDYAKYFAEVIWMNNTGTVLIMKKIKVIGHKTPIRRLPKRIPHFFYDVHRGNYGQVRGHLVCCDYGTTSITSCWQKRKTKKVNWE